MKCIGMHGTLLERFVSTTIRPFDRPRLLY